MNTPRVLCASKLAPGPVGGLSNYQAQLADAFTFRQAGEFCFFNPPIPENSLWMSLASRPISHAVLETLIERHFGEDIETLGRNLQAAHYVGTGWHYLGFAVSRLARKLEIPFSIWPAVHPGQWGDDQIDIRLYHTADTLLCQSHYEKHVLTERGIDPAKMQVCGLPPMCLQGGNGDTLRKKHHLEDRPCVLFVGNRVEAKGYANLLKAWFAVLAEVPRAVLLLAGPGGESFASLLKLLPSDSYRDLGVVVESEKADAYASCDVFCLPSAHESFGIVYPEAWSYAKPVVCGTAPASREWIHHGETGLHTDPTPESVAEALILLLKDTNTRQAMGHAGKRFQETYLTWDTTVAAHLRAFHFDS